MATKTPLYGLNKIRVGARFRIKSTDAKGAITWHERVVRDMRGREETDKVPFCVTCQKKYKTIGAMHTEHPEQRIMVRQKESHAWGYWSDTITDDTAFGISPVTNTGGEIVGANLGQMAVKVPVGLLSDRDFDQAVE